jgi:hypothetical protein
VPRIGPSGIIQTLDLDQLKECSKHDLNILWHPSGDLDWAKDPCEPLKIQRITVCRDDPNYTVKVQGTLTDEPAMRKIQFNGSHHRTGRPVFCDGRGGSGNEIAEYLYKAKKRVEWLEANKNEQSRQDCQEAKEQLARQTIKENTMNSTSKTNQIYTSLKNDIQGAAKHAGKVAVSCVAADIIAKHVRRFAGSHYPTFFTDSALGKVIEPVLLSGIVMLVGYTVQVYGQTKLPFQDTVMDGARYAMEGRVRDAIQQFSGPVISLFNELGQELKAAQPSEE